MVWKYTEVMEMRRTSLLAMVLAAGCITVCTAAGAQMAAAPAASAAKGPLAPLSESLTVTVHGKSRTFSVTELEAMPQKTLRVHNEHSGKDESYTGVLLSDLLAKCGLTFTKDTQKEFLHSTVRMEGTDKYYVYYSAAEISGELHTGSVIVAIKLNDGTLGIDGKFRMVSSEDSKPARWLRNMVSITVTEQP